MASQLKHPPLECPSFSMGDLNSIVIKRAEIQGAYGGTFVKNKNMCFGFIWGIKQPMPRIP